jgi:hypothetical protein
MHETGYKSGKKKDKKVPENSDFCHKMRQNSLSIVMISVDILRKILSPQTVLVVTGPIILREMGETPRKLTESEKVRWYIFHSLDYSS